MSHVRRSPPQNEVAARAAQLSALTRRRDTLLARTARDERNAAKLAGAAAKQRALGDVGDTTLKALSTCVATVEKARVELGQQKTHTDYVRARREMVWQRQRQRLAAETQQVAQTAGLLTAMKTERDQTTAATARLNARVLAATATGASAVGLRSDAEISATPDLKSRGSQAR